MTIITSTGTAIIITVTTITIIPTAGPQRACRQAGAVADAASAGRPGPEPPVDPATADLDLVETAFLEGFARAPDPSSFLRLAGIPFVGEAADGARLHLLRVETEDLVDVGAVMPLVGGAGVAYHPLPARLTSHRRRLAFVYHDGAGPKHLGFAAARALKDASASSQFAIPGATTAGARPLTTTEVKP